MLEGKAPMDYTAIAMMQQQGQLQGSQNLIQERIVYRDG